MKRLVLFAVLLLGACASGSKVATLGRVDDQALPSQGNWVLAATPSILRYAPSRRIEADMTAAIAHYEAVAAAEVDGDSRNEALRRAAYLRLQLADEALEPGEGQLRQAVAEYRELLRSAPQDPNRDQILYQLARAWQSLGEREAARDSLRTLQRDFADSPLQADVAFRLAELAFAQKDYVAAAQDYRRVLAAGPEGRFFEMAQYKLGWSAFRLSEHGEALAQFLALLQRELPANPGHDPAAVLAAAAPGRAPWIGDALRVISLALAADGGAAAWARHFPDPAEEPEFAPLLYVALGELLLEKRHYTGAAAAFAAYARRHPTTDLAPQFARRRIDSLAAGGFARETVRATVDYIEQFAPDAPYWSGRSPGPEVVTQWRDDVDTVAAHYHHLAQQSEAAGKPSARQDYLKAARWYQRRLQVLPGDAAAPQTRLLLAEALQAAGLLDQAVGHFTAAAYDYPDFARAGEAAYAAVLVSWSLAEAKPAETAQALAAAERLLEAFPQHPQWQPVLQRSLDAELTAENWPQVAALADRLLARPGLLAGHRQQALAAKADAHFAQAQYPAAEQAYRALLALPAAGQAPARQLALSIYRQGEQARTQEDLVAAARHFLRLGQELPDAEIRSEADFDAASALLAGQDTAAARPVLEALLARDPGHRLAGEARRKLAAVYEQLGEPVLAADRYLEIALAATGDRPLEQEALWHAAELYDGARAVMPAVRAYARYAEHFPQPLNRALRACARLAELERTSDPAGARRWLEALVEREQAGGPQRTDATRLQAARAALELGRDLLARAAGLPLSQPLEASLGTRQQLLEQGIAWLNRAAEAGFVETVPEATFATAGGYGDLARALAHAPPPRGLDELEQEEFRMLLEEQAFGFEELAIQWHESNLARLREDIWNRWIAASAQALAQMVPARYAKTELLVQHHATLD